MYRHKRKLNKRKIIISVAIIVFFTGLVIATSYNRLYISLLKNEVFNVVSIYIENKELKQSIELYKIQDMKLNLMEFDNRQLAKAVEAKKQLPPSYTYPIARIIDYKSPEENNGQVESIRIDLGKLDGIQEYESVISLDQYLIGVVTELEDHKSTVQLIHSEGFLKNQGISVVLGDHSTTGVLEYDLLENTPVINRISKDNKININDTVKTSGGDESRYPAGFNLGMISSISANRFGLLLQATVKLPPLSNDKFVFIVHSSNENVNERTNHK